MWQKNKIWMESRPSWMLLKQKIVVLNGLQYTNVQTAETAFSKLCSEVLDINLNVTNTTIIGKNSIMFGVESQAVVKDVISSKQKLKGQSIYIQNDYTQQEQNTRYNLWQSLFGKMKILQPFLKLMLIL